MGNEQSGTPLHQQIEGIQHRLLREWIQVGGRLIQDEQRSVLEQRTRNGETLPFPAGEPQPLFTYPRFKAVGQLTDKAGELRLLEDVSLDGALNLRAVGAPAQTEAHAAPVQGVQTEEVAVGGVPGWWTGAAIADGAEVVPALHRRSLSLPDPG